MKYEEEMHEPVINVQHIQSRKCLLNVSSDKQLMRHDTYWWYLFTNAVTNPNNHTTLYNKQTNEEIINIMYVDKLGDKHDGKW